MRILFKSLIAISLLATAAPAFAQEVLVTSQRRGFNSEGGYTNGVVATGRPIINLERTADYAVMLVRIVGDTRDAAVRMADLKAMIRSAIGKAGGSGIELAIGDYAIDPLTLNNYNNLIFNGDGRPDTSVTTFLAKVKLTPGLTIDAAKAKISGFVASVPKVGRSSMSVSGEPFLSIVNPDQYRGKIIEMIAADAATSAAKFGPGYGVEVTGLDRPVEWARSGAVEVFLYLPSTYTVKKD
jgi:hypothetical protein